MVRSSLLRTIAGLAAFCGILGGCDQRQAVDPGNRPDGDRFFVTITPKGDSLAVGETLPLTARVVDAFGAPRANQPVQWRSLASEIATVDGVGLVTGVAVGTAKILATVGTGAQLHADTATILVEAGTLALTVAPMLVEITLGDSLQLEATLVNSAGAAVRGLTAQWTTSDSTIAPVTQDGTLLSLSPGDVTITALVNGMTATASARVLDNPPASISVTPANSGINPGEQIRLIATVRDSRGRHLARADVRWASSAPTVATVSQDGYVRGVSRGAAVITATSGTLRASATVNVFPVPASSVTVSAPSNSVPQGGRLQAVATARDHDGNVLPGKTVAWSSSNPAVAQVGADGMITGITVGSTTIHAIIDSKIGSLPVSVVNSALSSLAIVPGSATVSLGNSAQLTAELRDQGGNLITGQVNWASANAAVATVNSNGLVTATGVGTTDINASAGTFSARSTITVTSAAVASVSINPSASQLQIGGTQQLTATVTSSNGSSIANAAVSWSTSNPAVVMVSSTGLATAVSPGTATISASSSGKSGSASVSVSSPAPLPVVSVSVTFNSPTLFIGQSTQATATARDANGGIITGRPVTWLSDDLPLASVSTSGLVTALAGGSATIIAKIDGVIGFATLSVGAPPPLPVATVQLVVNPNSINKGQTAASNVVLRDSLGNTLTGYTIGYTSSKPTVASVGLGGIVTGVGSGSASITATSQAKSGSAPITVASVALPSVATVTVSAPVTSLTAGQTSQATATARDSAGNVMAGQTFTWVSSNSAAATVSANGLITGVATGASTVTASASGKSGSIVVSVTSPSVASVTVSLPASSLTAGQSVQASATAKDASGNTIPASAMTWTSSNPAVATVSPTGLVTGVTAGSATISASSAGKSGSAALSVTPAAPAGPVPSIAASLPQSTVNVAWQAPTGNSIAVHAGGNLQNALNSAQRGDEIVIDAGVTFTGNFTLPAKSGTGWITVRTSALNSLPALGARIKPAVHASLMPKIVSPNTMAAISTSAGASGWRLVGLEVTIAPGVAVYPAVNGGIMQIGDGSMAQNLMSELPHDIILDRMYVHGQTNTNTTRCIGLNAGATAIIGSQLLECHAKGFDSQAIGGWNGSGPYLIENNQLEAAGEVIMFGGADPAIKNLIPSDITIRRNFLTRPMSWSSPACQWVVKNLLELKNAQRVLIEANAFDNHWADSNCGQSGYAIVFGSVEQDGNCDSCVVRDVSMQWNHLHNVAAGFNVFARCGKPTMQSPYGCGNNGAAQATTRITIRQNLVSSLGVAGLGTGYTPRCFILQEDVHDLWIENTTCFAPAGYMYLTGSGATAKRRFTFLNNVGGGAQYDWFGSAGFGDAGNAQYFVAPYVAAPNGFVHSATAGALPTGSLTVTSMSAVGYVSPVWPSGNWSLGTSSPFVGKGVDWATLQSKLVGVR